MRKLKVVLAVLCATTLSLGLAACKKDKDPEEQPENKQVISAISEANQSVLKLTDSDTEADFQAKLADYDVSVSYKGVSGRRTIKGSACEVVYGDSINYSHIGSYFVVLKPTGEANPNGLYARIQVDIEHDWGAEDPATHIHTCKKCHATQSSTELAKGSEQTLKFRAFHDDDNDFKEGAIVQEFGTVRINGTGRDVRVPSYTVGRLTKGASITVTGHAVSDSDSKAYYFPIIGIADSTAGTYRDGATYQGSSIFVRNEGWTLLNGVGNQRMLAYLAGKNGEAGSNENYNYGSLVTDTGAETDTRPAGYDDWKNNYSAYSNITTGNYSVPLKASDYQDWMVYTQGGILRTADYAGEGLDIEMTWTYRDDGIVELTIANPLGGGEYLNKLIARLRVPDNEKGYYETIIHGDYMTYTITGASYITPLSLTSIEASIASKKYLANTMLDLNDVTVMAKYLQKDQPEKASGYEVYGFIPGTNGKDELVPEEDAAPIKGTLIDLSADALQAGMEYIKVVLTVGPNTSEYVIDLTADDVDFDIISNYVSRVGTYPVALGNTVFGGSSVNTYNIAHDTVNNNDVAKVTLTGFAGTLTAAQKTALADKVTTQTKYFAFRVYANELGDKFTANAVGAGEGIAYAKASADGTYADIIIAIDKTKTSYTMTGLNGDTHVVFDIAGVQGIVADSAVTDGNVYINAESEITITYTFPAGTFTTAMSAWISGSTPEGAVGPLFLNNTSATSGFRIKAVTDGAGAAITDWASLKTLKITFVKPAVALSSAVFGNYVLDLTSMTGAVLARDVIKPVIGFSDAATVKGQVIAENTYAEVNGNMLYVARVLSKDEKIESSDLVVRNFMLNFNNGRVVTLYDLSGSYREEEGKFALSVGALGTGDEDENGHQTRAPQVATTLYIDGTLDENHDADYVAIVLYAIDLAQVSQDAVKLFDVPGANTDKYYKIENGTLTAINVPDETKNSDEKLLTENQGDCFEGALVGKEVKDGNNTIFYAGARYVGGEHEDKNGDKKCDLCGSDMEERTAPTGWFEGHFGIALNDGEFIDYIGKYSSKATECGGDSNTMNAYCLVIEDSNVANYVMNGDGYFERRDWEKGTTSTNKGWGDSTVPKSDAKNETVDYAADNEGKMEDHMTSTLITNDHPYNTVNGWKNESGVILDGTNFNTIKVGATFRYLISYQNGKYIARFRMWEEGVDTVAGVPIYDYTFTLTLAAGKTVYMQGYPDFTYANTELQVVRGTVERSILTEAVGATVEGHTSTNVASEPPVVEGDQVTLALTGMADKETTGNAYYLALDLKFSMTLAGSTVADVVTEQGEAIEGAVAKLNGTNAISVYLPIGTKESKLAKAKIVLSNLEGESKQTCDIILDLAKVLYSDYSATVENNLTFAGGTATLTLTGSGSAIDTNLEVTIGKTTKKLSQIAPDVVFETDNGKLTVTNKEISGATCTLTLALSDLDLTKTLVPYAITVKEGDNVVVTSSVNVKAPAENMVEGVYVKPEGTKLTLVVTEGVSNNAIKELKLNINNSALAAELYNVGFRVRNNSISFLEGNALSAGATTVYSPIGSGVAVIIFDLTKVDIEANAIYGIQAVIGAETEAEAHFLKVAADRSVTTLTADPGEATVVFAASCYHGEVTAKSIVLDGNLKFYYDATTGATSAHTWSETADADGYIRCTICDAIRISGKLDGNKKIAASEFADVTKNGLTVSFLGSTTSDWNASLTTGEADIRITFPNIDPNFSVEPKDHNLPDEIVALIKKLHGTNCYPGMADAIQPGFNAQPWNNVEKYATIVVDPNSGVKFYQEGRLAIFYELSDTLGNKSTIAEFVKLFLALTEEYGLILNGSSTSIKNAIVQPYALNDQMAKEHYRHIQDEHQHSYDPATHVCEEDGSIDPDPANHKNADGDSTFVNGVCAVCGFVCPHDDKVTTDDGCTYCGATVKEKTTTVAAADFATWKDPWNDFENFTLFKGQSVKIEGTYADGGVGTWNGMTTFIRAVDGGAADWLYVFRSSGDCAATGWAWGPANATVNPGFMGNHEADADKTKPNAYIALKKTAKFDIEVTFAADSDTVTVVKNVYNADGTTVGQALSLELTGMTENKYVVGFVLDGATISGNATVTHAEVTYPVHTHKWDTTTYLCKICGELNPDHPHNYVKNHCTLCGKLDPDHEHTFVDGYYCTSCEMLCEHANKTGEVCDDCGLTIKTAAAYTPVMYSGNGYALAKGAKKTYVGTIKSDMNANFEALLFGLAGSRVMRTDNYVIGTDADNGCVTTFAQNGVVIKNGEGTVVGGTDVENSVDWWASLKSIIKDGNATFELVFDWTGDNLVVTVTYKAHTGTYAGYTWSCGYTLTIAEGTESVDIQIGAEKATIGLTEVTAPATTPDEGDATEI